MFAAEWPWQGVWHSFPFLAWDLSLQPRAPIWIFNQFICIRACACSSNLNYAHKCIHWCASVLNKRFLTPFRDDIWNRRQVSVGDRGVLPTRPRNRRGYALLAYTLGKMRLCATGERSNMEIRTVELKNTIIQAKLFPVASTSHIGSPR